SRSGEKGRGDRGGFASSLPHAATPAFAESVRAPKADGEGAAGTLQSASRPSRAASHLQWQKRPSVEPQETSPDSALGPPAVVPVSRSGVSAFVKSGIPGPQVPELGRAAQEGVVMSLLAIKLTRTRLSGFRLVGSDRADRAGYARRVR